MSPAEDHIGLQLLSRAHSPTSATKIFNERVQLRPLLLKASEIQTTTPNARTHRRKLRLAADAKRKKATKPKPLSAHEKRAIGVHEIPLEEQKYEIYAPLHQLWLGYIYEVLGITGSNFNEVTAGSAAILTSADFHGAILEVVRSRCPSRVAIKGIVVRDTKFTFEMITANNLLKIVPKEHTVFRLKLPLPKAEVHDSNSQTKGAITLQAVRNAIFDIHGDQFQHRAVDRANKKFKPHWLPNI